MLVIILGTEAWIRMAIFSKSGAMGSEACVPIVLKLVCHDVTAEFIGSGTKVLLALGSEVTKDKVRAISCHKTS